MLAYLPVSSAAQAEAQTASARPVSRLTGSTSASWTTDRIDCEAGEKGVLTVVPPLPPGCLATSG